MALISGQLAIGTASTTLFPYPSGAGVVTINSATASTNTAYIGMGTAGAGTANSYILDPGHTLTFATYSPSAKSTISAISAGSATLSWVISTNS